MTLPSPTPENPWPRELCVRCQLDGFLVRATQVTHDFMRPARLCDAHVWVSDLPVHPVDVDCEQCRD